MKVVIEMTPQEALKLTPLARRLFEDSESAAERRHAQNGYVASQWEKMSEAIHRHWLRHAALQEWIEA